MQKYQIENVIKSRCKKEREERREASKILTEFVRSQIL